MFSKTKLSFGIYLVLLLIAACMVFLVFGCSENLVINDVGFKITEPMYAVVIGEVTGTEKSNNKMMVEVKVREILDPSGIGNNEYAGKKIKEGTRLTVEWGNAVEPGKGKTYEIPAECTSSGNAITVRLKGNPKEVTVKD